MIDRCAGRSGVNRRGREGLTPRSLKLYTRPSPPKLRPMRGELPSDAVERARHCDKAGERASERGIRLTVGRSAEPQVGSIFLCRPSVRPSVRLSVRLCVAGCSSRFPSSNGPLRRPSPSTLPPANSSNTRRRNSFLPARSARSAGHGGSIYLSGRFLQFSLYTNWFCLSLWRHEGELGIKKPSCQCMLARFSFSIPPAAL